LSLLEIAYIRAYNCPSRPSGSSGTLSSFILAMMFISEKHLLREGRSVSSPRTKAIASNSSL
jgi:hypothetical protein